MQTLQKTNIIKNDRSKKVYVILSRSGTYPSRLIKLFTGGEFTHSSIAIAPCKHRLYSFGRKKMNNFFIGGFLREDVDKFLFAKFPDTPCAVYVIALSENGYKLLSSQLKCYKEKCQKYKYNFAGLATTQFGIKRELKYRYTCAQFVASLLEETGEVSLPKHRSLMKPMDFTRIPEARLIYKGKLKDISFD